MSAFAAWLIGFSKSFIIWLYNSSIGLINSAISGFCSFVLSVLTLFPDGAAMPSLPAPPSDDTWLAFLNGLNWFFPMGFFVQLLGVVIGGIIIYITIMPLARWLKLLN